jgi:hypothetical protein
LKHSFVATQDLKYTCTSAEEADSGKKMLPKTEQVPATEGAAAEKRRRYSQAAKGSKDEASRGAKHLKQAAQAIQGGKYSKQRDEASQPKQTFNESTEIKIPGIIEKRQKNGPKQEESSRSRRSYRTH